MSHKIRLLQIAAFAATILLIASSAIAQGDPDATESGAAESNAAEIEAIRLQRIKQRMRAEGLEKEGKHIACGQAYLDIYKANPAAEGMDEVLYNAGVCFEDGKATGLVIRMYSELGKRFPNSPLNRKALVRTGSIYGAMANYRQAAEAYERYAKRYAGEKDAPDALENAVTYRKAIGNDKEAITNIETYIKRYGKKRKDKAAAAIFGLADIYERQGNQDAVIKAYKRYIKEMGKSGGSDRLLVAHAKIGEILWKQSCKSATQDGVCVRIKRERAVASDRKASARRIDFPTQCGPKTMVKRTVLPRDGRLVKEATSYFKAALSLANKGAIDKVPEAGRKAAAIYWMAASRFYMNEQRYEKFLAIKFPSKLNFSSRSPREEKKKKDSTKRFDKWIDEKTKVARMLSNEYVAIKEITGGGAAWAVAAAARVGQMHRSFADVLLTTEIPRPVRTGPHAAADVKQHCAIVTANAAPLEELSLPAFDFCLRLSQKLNWFNNWSRLCANQLSELRPADYPRANEVHGPSTGVSDILDTEALSTNR